jgi:MFS family permease
VLLLPFVDAVWQVYLLIFVINACSAGFTPLFQATIPDVLTDEAVYTRALSLSRLAYDLQQLLAPALAGVLLWFLPLDALFAVNGLVTTAYAASGAGSMLAALLLPRVLDRIAERTMMLAGGAVMALGMAAGMLMPSLVGLLVIWFLGVGSSLVQTPGGRLLRRSSHEEDRPALFSAQFALSHACWLVTYLVAGVVGNAIGLFWTFGLLGLLVIVSSGFAMRLWPSTDPELLEHEHAPLAHEHLHTHDEHHQHEHEGWEGPEPHRHPHGHLPQRHCHRYVIDVHHQHWPA